MALFRKFFYRKPPDGLLEISERVYVFDCCFSTDVLEEDDYKVYMGGIVGPLRDQFPDASFMVFNFREGERQSLISNILSEYDMIVMDYPRHYEGCPLLTMEMIHHFLRSSESWLSLGQQNVLLMHCERGGWPVLAFMLAALLIYRKQYTGEQKTLDMIYKQAPRELLQLLSPLNPLPSQLRYLQYVSRRNVGSEWPPLDRALTLDCVILRFIPNFDGEGGCRPIFRIYGQDPFIAADRTPKVLFSTPKKSKSVRLYKQADCELVKIDIHCHIQGDVVLECISLDDDLEREGMMFRVMFNTAFIRSNILMLNRDEIDILWNAKDQFPKEFRAEVLLSEMDAASSLITVDLDSTDDKEGLPIEAFAKVQEIFSDVDWLDTKGDVALQVLQKMTATNTMIEKLEVGLGLQSHPETNALLQDTSPPKILEKLIPDASEDKITIISTLNMQQQSSPVPKTSQDLDSTKQKLQHQEISVALQHPSQPKIISQRVPPSSFSNPVSYTNSLQGSPVSLSRYHSAPSALGITALLHDHAVYARAEAAQSASSCNSVAVAPLPHTGLTVRTSIETPPPSPSPPAPLLESVPSQPLTDLAPTPPPPPGISSPARSQSVSDPPPPPPPVSLCSGASLSDVLVSDMHHSPSPLEVSSGPIINEKLSPTPLPPLPKSTFSPPPPPRKTTFSSPPPPPPPPPPPSTPPPPPTTVLSASPPPPPPLPITMSTTFSPPPPPPPPPPMFASSATPPPPPLPPMTNLAATGGPPPPPPPPLHSRSTSSPATVAPPPPPQPPFPSKPHGGPVSQNAPCAPPVPPPPIPGVHTPLTNGTQSKGASGFPGPPPPAIGPGPLGLKGRGPTRSLGLKNQSTSKKASLKPLHWVKVTRVMQGSLWAESTKSDEATKAPEFDMSELESLFSATVPNPDSGKAGESKGRRASRGPKSDKVHLIDLRRANNCEIMLTKVKMPLSDLMSTLLALDDSVLDVDQVDNLIKFCPTKEEMELLKGYTGDKENLGKCEQFFLELMKVPRVESKLRVFSFKIQFNSQVSDLRNSLNIVNSVAEEIRTSAKLKRILQTILSLGNALNQGTARGSAVGFRLDSLLKLADTRARNNKMTLMHYLCKVLAEKLPGLLDFHKDLVSLEISSKIQLKSLAEEMQAISKGLEKVEQELTASENDGPVSQNFCKTLKEFLVVAEAEVRSLTSLYSGVGRNADALAVYFGEDPARCPFEQVVSTLLNFVRMFGRAHEENCKKLDLEKKKAQKEAEMEKMKIGTPKKEESLLRSTLRSGNT